MARIRKFHVASCSGTKCECSWELDYRPLGVRGPRQRLRFRTHKQAEQFLSETQHRVTRGEYIDPAKIPKFGEVAEEWYLSKLYRRPSHVANLRSRLDKHLTPIFGTRRLDAVGAADLERLRDVMRQKGYAVSTINHVLRIAGAVFKFAVRRGYCASNPLDRVECAQKAAVEMTGDDVRLDEPITADNVLNPAEIRRLLDAANPGFDRTLFLTAFVTGAREGELLALRWTDLELPKGGTGRMCIRRSLSWAHAKGEAGRPRFFPPKTKAGLRLIQIPAELVAALKRWRLQCAPSPDGLVFPREDGQPMYRERLLRKAFYPALSRARLRRVTFHSLRHSCASAMIAAGAPVTEVQHQLGHSNPAITLGVYSHWFQGATGGGAVERLAAMVLGAPNSEVSGMWAVCGQFDHVEPAASNTIA
ncbi:MAG TPA: site-specific integrase [Candidatus Binataceae bacterium]|nr:site-specific integrase [Candidatus Binataceae bacterium]